MNILLDENLDWRLQRDLPGHTVESVPLIGWAGLKNGALLAEAEKRFDVLVTMDSNMVHQQNLARFRIAVIALQAPSNRLADTRPLVHSMVGLTPEERFANHRQGIKAAAVVECYGLRVLPGLHAHLNPMPYEAAVQMERDLAEDLRRVGYTVTGGR